MTSADSPHRERIYLEFKNKVAGYVHSRISNRHDAEDLVASIFLKVYDKLDEYDSSRASLSTWIYTITSNAVIDWHRRTRPTLELADDLSAQGGVEESVLRAEALSALAGALAKLPERERDIVILRYYRRLTLKEIAARMGLSYTTVKAAHSSGLAQLKRLLER